MDFIKKERNLAYEECSAQAKENFLQVLLENLEVFKHFPLLMRQCLLACQCSIYNTLLYDNRSFEQLDRICCSVRISDRVQIFGSSFYWHIEINIFNVLVYGH